MKRSAATSPLATADALAQLQEPGCAICGAVDVAEQRFFSWFATETATDPVMVDKLRASGGMCPRHTRRLWAQDNAAARLTRLYAQILPAAHARLAAGQPLTRQCPACAAGEQTTADARDNLVQALDDERVRARYVNGDGLCLPHLSLVFQTEPAGAAPLLAVTAAQRLSDGRPSLGLLAGSDTDAPVRARWRPLLPAAGMSGGADADPVDTLGRQRARLGINACSICLCEGQSERQYLTWLAAEHRRDPRGLAREPGGFCPRHLHDLAVVEGAVVEWALAREWARWRTRWTRAHAILTRGPADGRSARSAVPRGIRVRRFPREDLAEALAGDVCMVCRAVSATSDGESAVLTAALGFRSFIAAYEDAQGLCLRHVASIAAHPDVATVVRRVAMAHTDLLICELTEADRKTGWSARHEVRGPESTAWVRAAALLDGRVFGGGPAHTR